MAQFVLTYLGGEQPASPEEGQKHFQRYKEWLLSLGAAAVSPANPLKNTHTVTCDGDVKATGVTGMSGFTIIEAESMDAALAIAKKCPFLDIGGNLEVSERVLMSL